MTLYIAWTAQKRLLSSTRFLLRTLGTVDLVGSGSRDDVLRDVFRLSQTWLFQNKKQKMHKWTFDLKPVWLMENQVIQSDHSEIGILKFTVFVVNWWGSLHSFWILRIRGHTRVYLCVNRNIEQNMKMVIEIGSWGGIAELNHVWNTDFRSRKLGFLRAQTRFLFYFSFWQNVLISSTQWAQKHHIKPTGEQKCTGLNSHNEMHENSCLK